MWGNLVRLSVITILVGSVGCSPAKKELEPGELQPGDIPANLQAHEVSKTYPPASDTELATVKSLFAGMKLVPGEVLFDVTDGDYSDEQEKRNERDKMSPETKEIFKRIKGSCSIDNPKNETTDYPASAQGPIQAGHGYKEKSLGVVQGEKCPVNLVKTVDADTKYTRIDRNSFDEVTLIEVARKESRIQALAILDEGLQNRAGIKTDSLTMLLSSNLRSTEGGKKTMVYSRGSGIGNVNHLTLGAVEANFYFEQLWKDMKVKATRSIYMSMTLKSKNLPTLELQVMTAEGSEPQMYLNGVLKTKGEIEDLFGDDFVDSMSSK